MTEREKVRAAARDALTPELMDELMVKVRSNGLKLLGDGGLVGELTKKLFERAIAEELTDHVGYEVGDRAGHGSGNSRNGTTPKRVLTDIGAVDLDVPRDRDGSLGLGCLRAWRASAGCMLKADLGDIAPRSTMSTASSN